MSVLPATLPFFSVLICNYNYERFVGDAIRSALAQDYPADRFEVIVVDDGSTDGSRAVIASFAGDARVRPLLQPNRGQSAAFDAGVRIARGDYICLLDSDDVFLPHKLARVAQRIAGLGHPPGLLLCHDLVIEDMTGEAAGHRTWFEMMGIRRERDALTIDEVVTRFPFSNPCGIVASRPDVQAFFDSFPVWAFLRGTDMIMCHAMVMRIGVVHHLHECLGTYRVHGGNELASFVDGRYSPRLDLRPRMPGALRFLEQWVDILELAPDRRASALAYVRRLEHINRMPSQSHRLAEPLVSVVLFAGDDAALAASIESAALQSWGAIELVLPAGVAPGPAAAAAARAVRRFDDDAAAGDFDRLGRAHAAAAGEFVVFLRAGDVLVREFVERHVYLRQRVALVGVSCSDIRLLGPGASLLHDDVFANSGAWVQPVQQIPPLATGLGDWVGVPISACMFRRGELFDRFFAAPGEMSDALRAGGFWLMFQLQQQTAGVLRLRETLTSVALPDAAAASYGYLSAPAGLAGPLPAMPVREAALWLQEFFLEHEEAFLRWLPPAWHRNFEPWLDRQTA